MGASVCPECGGKKTYRAKVCRRCFGPQRQLPHPPCPECGGKKSYRAKLCRRCWDAQRKLPRPFCPDCGVGVSRKGCRCSSCASKKRWANPAYARAVSEAAIVTLSSPDVRKRSLQRSRDIDVVRKKRRTALKLWSDPAYRRKHKEAMARPGVRARASGENCHLWRGGISRTDYGSDFTSELRHSIRERDGFTCVMCGSPQSGRILDVHHIDYDKNNSGRSNLLSLCASCHRKTNFDRDYWRIGFQQLMGNSNQEGGHD